MGLLDDIFSDLTSGKGLSGGKKLNSKPAKGSRKTPVHGAVSDASKFLDNVLGGGTKRTSGTPKAAASTKKAPIKHQGKEISAGEANKITSHKAEVSAFGNKRGFKTFKEAEGAFNRDKAARAAASKGASPAGTTSRKSIAKAKAKAKAARKTKNPKASRRASRRVKRRSKN